MKEMLIYFLSRYGYILYMQGCLIVLGISGWSSFFLMLPLILLIAWRDSQFIDEDGYNMVFSLESKIQENLAKIWKRFRMMISQYSQDGKAQIYNRYTKKWENIK